MDQCKYWWLDGKSGWCELIGGVCSCGGHDAHCAVAHNAASSALLEEEKASLEKLALYAATKRRAA